MAAKAMVKPPNCHYCVHISPPSSGVNRGPINFKLILRRRVQNAKPNLPLRGRKKGDPSGSPFSK